jgi:hypothetical protein
VAHPQQHGARCGPPSTIQTPLRRRVAVDCKRLGQRLDYTNSLIGCGKRPKSLIGCGKRPRVLLAIGPDYRLSNRQSCKDAGEHGMFARLTQHVAQLCCCTSRFHASHSLLPGSAEARCSFHECADGIARAAPISIPRGAFSLSLARSMSSLEIYVITIVHRIITIVHRIGARADPMGDSDDPMAATGGVSGSTLRELSFIERKRRGHLRNQTRGSR